MRSPFLVFIFICLLMSLTSFKESEAAEKRTRFCNGSFRTFLSGFDTLSNRRESADNINLLVEKFKQSPTDARLKAMIEQLAVGGNRFTACYNIDAIGRLGPLAAPFVPLIAQGLSSIDPFVRETASHALQRIGGPAVAAKSELIGAVRKYVNEGTARYAIQALASLKDDSKELLSVLRYAVRAPDSYGREEAQATYHDLTGTWAPMRT